MGTHLARTVCAVSIAVGASLTGGCAQDGDGPRRAAVAAAAHAREPRALGTEAERKNAATVRALYKEVFSQHRLERADLYLRKDYVQHTPNVPMGLSGFKLFYEEVFFKTFPDVTATVDQVVAQNDRVVTFATWRGRQTGTGKKLLLKTADVYRFQNGMLAEHWDVIDYSVLQEFDIKPPAVDQPATPADQVGTPAQLANLRLATGFLDEVVTKRRPDRLGAYVAADLEQHSPAISPGARGIDDHLRRYFAMFPDLKITVTHVVAGKDRVAFFLTWRGRQAGTGKELRLHTADLYRIENGRLAEHWDTVDRSSLTPLGIRPAG